MPLERDAIPMSRRAANQDLRVLISGAGSGVGLACAYVFASRGAELILCDSDGVALTRASDATGGFSRFCDVVSESSVAVFASEIAAKFDTFDILINAAGKSYVRTLGMMQMSRTMLPALRRGSGRRVIVNVAPAGGLKLSSMFPYASSREGFQGLSDALADQTRGSMIDVVTITPDVQFDPASGDSPFYRVERVDEDSTAERILELAASARPEWRQRDSRRNRRA
jgi:NAD(P)-dependent dehydrogenase (short-subunit alcohol dehydrogenase family)